MVWTNIKRIFRSGVVSFWRNGVVSLSSAFVMIITLFVIGSLIFLGAVLNASLTQLKNKVDVNVYFTTEASEQSVKELQRSVKALPEVASTQYISRDEALERFRERHEDDQVTLQALEELDTNPLGANLRITATDPSHYERIANFIEQNAPVAEGQSVVDKVNFYQNRAAIEKLSAIIDSAERMGLALIVILAVISFLITFNTTRLAIYTARDEITVMRLVGASASYIRGPFVIEGVMTGVVAGLITLAVFYPITYWLGPVTENFFGNINIFSYYITHFAQIFALILGAGVVLGGLSSYLAVRRYLKV